MDLSHLLCVIQDHDKVPYNKTELFNVSSLDSDASSSETEAKGLGAVTGILVVLLIDILISIEYGGSHKSALSKVFNRKNFSRTLVLTVAVLILPIIILFLLLASVYKVLCSVIIKKDKYFVGFLDSFDVFWSLEDDSSKSIINVLGIIESESSDVIAVNIKDNLKNIVHQDGSEKIFYRRKEKFGFFYWQRHSVVDMDQYVEIVELPDELRHTNEAQLEYLMADLQDQLLPYEDEGLFKILITRQRVGNHDELRGEYGIIFRIHHSVGDGVALIEFLCQSFADKTESCQINMFSMPENSNQNTPSNLINMMHKLLEIPICFVDGILRKPDNNAIHGLSLLGKKVFKWTESDENLLVMVKHIKENIHQINFCDILLTALSNGLRDFLSQKIATVPEDMAVILPVRFPKSWTENHMMLKNDFSVTLLDVPVKNRENVNEIRKRCEILRNSADPLTNYYFLKIVCSVLPQSILQNLLVSNQATMVFSNMPGPDILTICGGNVLKSLVFFVPHKGTTGLGVTALCYGGVLRFAAMADVALVSSSEELAPILDGMVNEIARLHQLYDK